MGCTLPKESPWPEPILGRGGGGGHLVAEGAEGEVGALGDVEEAAGGRLHDAARAGGPQLAQQPEEGRLAAPVRPRDQQVAPAPRRGSATRGKPLIGWIPCRTTASRESLAYPARDSFKMIFLNKRAMIKNSDPDHTTLGM